MRSQACQSEAHDHHDTLPTAKNAGPTQHAQIIGRIRTNLERVIMGKAAEIELLLAAILSDCPRMNGK